jgi:hypothetical protein
VTIELRLALLVGEGALPEGWHRTRWEGSEPHAERTWGARDTQQPAWEQRRCWARVHHDGRWSMRGDDGPSQRQVANCRAADIAAAFAEAEATAARWMEAPVGSAWEEPPPDLRDYVPGDGWGRIDGTRWATDRCNIVSEHAPHLHRQTGRSWVWPAPVEGMQQYLLQVHTEPSLPEPPAGLHLPRHLPRVAPLFDPEPDRIWYGLETAGLFRGEQLFAVVGYCACEEQP